VEIRLNSSLVAMGRDFADIEESASAAPDSGRRISRVRTRTVIWCAGIAPTPLTLEVDVPRDERGYILCERDLRVRGMENVWAIGDCAVNLDAQGRAYPATAQHAVQQGKHLARNLALLLAGRAALPCDIVDKGSLAALGCRTGVAKVFGLRFSGFAAWWLWRTVYLLKMPGWGRRVRVALDWTLDLFFRRDYVQLGVHRREAGPR
jgi:NADH dehydrogenase